MKLVYLVTEDWYFYSHRLPMLRGALRAGFDVTVICNAGSMAGEIEKLGVRVIPLSLDRKSLNPLAALRQIRALTKIYKEINPMIVHHIALKPILYGSIAARLARLPHVLNAFAGLGTVFHSDIFLARALRIVLIPAFRVLLRQRGSWTLFQNVDDRRRFADLGLIVPARTAIIRGSGVEVERYPVTPLPPAPPFMCAYAGRMIEMKGLQTMQDAFKILQHKAPQIRLWLCGTPDPANPQSWDEARLRAWCAENPNVVWKGHQDMAKIWPQIHLALQPTIGGEGLPKALLEAGACARAMVATDVPGCREVIAYGVNGLLIRQKDPMALANAILKLAEDTDLCARMGEQSRKMVEQDLSAESVTHQTEHLYKKMMAL